MHLVPRSTLALSLEDQRLFHLLCGSAFSVDRVDNVLLIFKGMGAQRQGGMLREILRTVELADPSLIAESLELARLFLPVVPRDWRAFLLDELCVTLHTTAYSTVRRLIMRLLWDAGWIHEDNAVEGLTASTREHCERGRQQSYAPLQPAIRRAKPARQRRRDSSGHADR